MEQTLNNISEVFATAHESDSDRLLNITLKEKQDARTIFHKWYFLSPLILEKIIWIPTRFLLCYFGMMKIKGMENLKDVHSPVIFACNHTSEMDPLFVPASMPFFSRFSPIFYTSRESAFYKNCGWRKHFYGGFLFKAWGAYPVHVGLRDYGKALENQIRIMNDGGCLCFFPEGRTTPDGTIKIAKGGVAFLAYMTRATIVPVRIKGVFRVTMKEFFARKRPMSITYGKPLTIAGAPNTELGQADFKMYANYIMGEIAKLE